MCVYLRLNGCVWRQSRGVIREPAAVNEAVCLWYMHLKEMYHFQSHQISLWSVVECQKWFVGNSCSRKFLFRILKSNYLWQWAIHKFLCTQFLFQIPFFLTCTLSFTHMCAHTHTHTRTHTHTHMHVQEHVHTHSLSLCLSHTCPCTVSLLLWCTEM